VVLRTNFFSGAHFSCIPIFAASCCFVPRDFPRTLFGELQVSTELFPSDPFWGESVLLAGIFYECVKTRVHLCQGSIVPDVIFRIQQFSPQRVPTEMPAWLPVTSFISREWLGEDDALEHKNIDAAKSEFETELTDTSTTLSKYHAPPVGPSNTHWNRGREGVGGERSTGTELDSHRPISPSTSSSNCHSLDATLVRNSGINFKAPHGRVSSPSPPRTPALDKISFAPSLAKMELECNTVTRDFMDSLKECSPTCGQGSSRDDADGMAELLSMCDILTHGLRDEETWGAGESQTTDINNVGLHMIIEDSGLFEKIPQIAFEHLGRTDDMCDLLTFGGTCPPLGA